MKHIDEIRIFLYFHGIFIAYVLHMYAINESKIDSSIRDSEIHINNYSIIHLDRNRFGGGVAIYIKILFHTLREGILSVIT